MWRFSISVFRVGGYFSAGRSVANSHSVAKTKAVRLNVTIGFTISVGVEKEASVDATHDGTYFKFLRRGILNTWNRKVRQEDC